MPREFEFSFAPKSPKLRPCKVDGEKALFHRWEDYATVIEPSPMVGGHPGGQLRETFAIVEMESGQVREVKPSKVTFEDTRDYLALLVANEVRPNETDRR